MTKRQAKEIAQHVAASLIDQFDANGLDDSWDLITEEEGDKIIHEMKLIVDKLSQKHAVNGATRNIIELVLTHPS